jgi:amino acid adenylation domain-containing protein
LPNLEEVPVSLLDLEVERIPLPEPEAKFDITLYAIQEREGIKLHAVYNTELFHGETIERMLAQLHLLLEQMVLNPAVSIYSYALVRRQDRAVLPDPTSPLSHCEEKTIQDGFVVQAKRVPQRIAIVDAAGEWTYAELELMSNRLANHLRREGVCNGDVVAVYASRSAALVWCLIGIMKSGGAFLILDSAYPANRLCGCIAQAKPVALLTLASAGELPGVIKECVGRDNLRCQLEIPAGKAQALDGFLSHCDVTDPRVSVTGDDPAYVAFTSGSTGEPLGIQGTHPPTSHFLRWHIDRFGLGEDDRFSLLSGLAHDPLLRDVFTPLWLGASLHIPPTEVREESGAMARWVREQRITVCHLTPALTELLGEPAAGNLDVLDSLRWVFLGGDKLTRATVQRLRRWTASCGLVNFYGTTETPQAMGYHVIEASEMNGRPSAGEAPLGRGIDGVQLLLLNPAGQVSGIGELAEIYVRTRYLSKGYLGNDTLTRERFQRNPFTAAPEDRIYRTGDMGRYLAGGGVALAGRKDAQVKIRGFRVELCEVEIALRGLPDVREAVVMAREDTPGDNRLVAYLVARADRKADAVTLRAMLLDKLPDYMLPSASVWLDQMPLTPNGKVDRKALPAPEKFSGGISSDANQPVNLLELELTGIWQRLFNRQDIGIHDNFFDLGGHSLQAVRVAAEIGKLLGCKLPIAALFQSPTVESLARRLTDEQWAPAWSSLVPLQPLGTKPPLFLVHGWGGDVYVFLGLAQLLAPDQPVYGIQALGLDGKAERHITVESMAAHYVEEIRSFQPEGPYFLGGYSLGGTIAYEVAQQLERLGQRVALLALFDSSPKGVLPWTIYGRIMATYLSGRGVFHLRRWWGKPNRERLDYLRGRWVALQFWMARNRPKPPVLTAPPPPDIQAPQVAGFGDYYQAVGAAYQYHQYPGAADVFVSDETQLYWMSGWRYFLQGGVTFHRVPGKHSEILAPEYVPLLAKALTSVLQRANLTEDTGPSHSEPADATRIS